MFGKFGSENRPVVVGDKLSFTYNDKLRVGTVEKVRETYFTIEFADGSYKSFNWAKVQGDITVLSTADGKSGFVQGLKEIQASK